MTDRERFLNHMHFKPVDRCFNMETGFWEELFTDWKRFRQAGVKDLAGANALLGLDTLENFWGDRIWANTFLEPYYAHDLVEEREKTVLKYNGYGVIIEEMKPAYGQRSRMIRPSVVTPDDWKRVKAERLVVDDPKRNVNPAKVKASLTGMGDKPVGLFLGSVVGFIAQMLTFEGMACACYDYPDMAEDMVDTCYRLIDRFMDQVLPLYPFDIACLYENITCKNGPLLPMWFFKEVVIPRYKRITQKLRAYGVQLISVGSDGDIRPLLPLLIEAGVNCLSPYEVNGCVPPGELLAQYPGVLRIIGGVDKLEIAKGRDATDRLMDGLSDTVRRGGFIPHIDHDVPPSIREADFLYYLERKRHLL